MLPFIDTDFMPGERKKRAPLDEKTAKRKIKSEEKLMMRELKKDTLVI